MIVYGECKMNGREYRENRMKETVYGVKTKMTAKTSPFLGLFGFNK